jgi:hypothetical protein
MTDPNVLKALTALTNALSWMYQPGAHAEGKSRECIDLAHQATRAAAEKPAEAAPVAPLPWVVRWVASKKEIARCADESDARTLRDAYLTSAVEVAPAAPTVAAVKFDGNEQASGDGWVVTMPPTLHRWSRDSKPARSVCVTIALRPGEDAGVTVATILAAVGRGL